MPYTFGQAAKPVWQTNPLANLMVTAPPVTRTAGFPSASATKQTLGSIVRDKVASVAQKVLPKRTAERLADLTDYTPVAALSSAFGLGQDLRASNVGGAIANGIDTALNFVPDGALAGKVAHSIIAPLWHGSPHKFEKFALEKIGTGEGAQAYGHGLYFAENPAVAQDYRMMLAHKAGANTGVNARTYNLALTAQKEAPNDPLGFLHREALAMPASQRQEYFDAMNNYDTVLRNQPGHLYEVKLDANPEDFLDWDAPLGQQPEHIRKGLGQVADIHHGLTGGDALVNLDPNALRYAPEQYGSRAWYDLNNIYGPNAASANLKSAGIPGIRYLDQGSRTAGQGTHNYVVFDPNIIDILNRH